MSGAPNPKAQELLKAGVAAARSGEKDKARELLQQVVELDEYNEQGWFWLASVVETDEERRTCLGNVVLINPQNARAQALLDQLERIAAGEVKPGGVTSGLDRRRMILLSAGAALVLVVCAVVVLNLAGGGDKESATESATDQQVVAGTTESSTPGASAQTGATATLSPDQLSLTPPTATPFVVATLPPAATSTPTPSRGGALPTLPPAPTTLSGLLLISSGDAIGDKEYQPIQVVPLNNPTQFIAATENQLRGGSPSFAPNGLRYVYAQFNTGQRSVTLQVANINGTNSRILATFWGFDPSIPIQLMPAWSPVADRVAFAGRSTGGRQHDLYVVDTPETIPNPVPAEALRQLTNDAVDETWPAWSPDGQRLVHVADSSQVGINGVDLRVIHVESGAIQYLTRDNLAVVETAPDWGGPNNNWVVYSGTAQGANQSNIWMVSLDNLSDEVPDPLIVPTPETAALEDQIGPRLLIDLGPHDIQPRWSPDGQYIVFSSDYTGEYDVYIYDFETGEIFAFTNSPRNVDIANDWIAR